MNNNQEKLLMMYIDIKNVLDKHNIRHYLIYGTALGAIRHDGFIPWDDDIDIGVFDEDLNKINEVLSKELDPDKYYYHDPIVDSHPHVVLKEENFEGNLKNKKVIFIDIFQFRKYPYGKIRRIFFDGLICLNVLTIYAIEKIHNGAFTKIFSWMPRSFERISKILPEKDSKFIVNFSSTYKKERYERDDFGEPQQHIFETITAPLPENAVKIMIQQYGENYMTPPPENERKGAEGYPVNLYEDYISKKKKRANNKY